MSSHKRLIEVTLPLAEISVQSAREKSIRHGHISTLHIWWARRPLAAMRAAIFASLIPDPGDDEKRKKLEDLIKIIVDWDQVKDGNSDKIEEAKELIRQAFPDHPPRLLDPFMGGGATGLEALRLGCETHAVELNPVAHLIELCTLVYPQQYGQPEKRLVQHGAVEVEEWVNPLAEDVRKWGTVGAGASQGGNWPPIRQPGRPGDYRRLPLGAHCHLSQPCVPGGNAAGAAVVAGEYRQPQDCPQAGSGPGGEAYRVRGGEPGPGTAQ